jgi:asparagine synthase (glutamine-hydrolysing)
MCGIAGIVSLDPEMRIDPPRAEQMRDVLRHRGPDDAGLWHDEGVALAHRRLSIVDVAGGAQPMANEDETVWLVCNGEIYNHPTLRRELEALGHRYRTRSDSETILHLYEQEGDRCVERLQGMFAFALWDRRAGRLLRARDRLGIKPLYYAQTEHELLFASEIKAILAGGTITAAFNESVLPEFLATRFVSGEETFFRGVQKLLPGRLLTWSRAAGLDVRRYWRLPPGEGNHVTRAGLTQELRSQLQRTVESHLMSDVPLGLFLSGGLDSSLLAGLMAASGHRPLHTFSVGIDEPDANELDYARQVAEHVGSHHQDVTVSQTRFFEQLPRLVWHEDEPIAFPSSVLLYFVAALARGQVKVVLTGEGADELFLGYNWYRTTAWNERLGSAYWRCLPSPARRRVSAAIRSSPRQLQRYASRSFLALEPGTRLVHCENFAPFPSGLRRLLLGDRTADNGGDPFGHWLRAYEMDGGSNLGRMSRADLETFVVELLMKQDQMSMAASVESRVPFLDHELVETVVRIPARFKLRGLRTKSILRDASAGLVPTPILRRGKMGFPVPVDRWFRGPSWPLIERLVLGRRARERALFDPDVVRQLAHEHRAGEARHGERLWLLMNLELWHRIFIDGEAPTAAIMAEA